MPNEDPSVPIGTISAFTDIERVRPQFQHISVTPQQLEAIRVGRFSGVSMGYTVNVAPPVPASDAVFRPYIDDTTVVTPTFVRTPYPTFYSRVQAQQREQQMALEDQRVFDILDRMTYEVQQEIEKTRLTYPTIFDRLCGVEDIV